jgi:capsular exopolysaccharide synthesis family protein
VDNSLWGDLAVNSVTYLRALLRSWWLIALVLLAGAAGGFVVYTQATPLYASSVTFIVAADLPDADESSSRTLSGLRASTIQSVAPTEPVLKAAAEKAGVDDLTDVAVSADVSKSFVTVTVTGPQASTVSEVAGAYLEVLPAQTDKLAGATGTNFDLNLVSPATEATSPVSPQLWRTAGFGLLAGLVLGLALAVLRESLNRTIRDSEQLRRLTGLTILGTVPRDLPKQRLPAETHPRSARAEAYRQVRTSLVSRSEARPLVVAVTSATQGEGKTSVASNLAVVLSRSGHRVALVDADLRRPRVATFFDVDPAVGLTDVLTGEVPLADALHLRDDNRFAVLPAGSIPTNPSEALGSPGMRDVLDALSQAFEFVIVDTPPVLPVTDALVLSPLVDGVMVVARLGYTTSDRVVSAMANIDRVNATVLGVVANQSGKGSDADYSYSYSDPAGSGRRAGRGEEAAISPEHLGLVHQSGSGSDGGRHRGVKPTVPVDDGAVGRRSRTASADEQS